MKLCPCFAAVALVGSTVFLLLLPVLHTAIVTPIRCDNLSLASRLSILPYSGTTSTDTDSATNRLTVDLEQLQRMCMEVTVDMLGMQGEYVSPIILFRSISIFRIYYAVRLGYQTKL